MGQEQNQAEGGVRGRQMDFVPVKPPMSTPPQAKGDQNTPPVPVTSAKAAINAMYAKPAAQPQPTMHMSAREAMNAAAKQQADQISKSAAKLHHGSIQKSMESTKVSASALLKVAKSPEPDARQVHPKASFDPLARTNEAKSTVQDTDTEVPVIRTSLKLGAAEQPKKRPVVLPPGARMARVARPVNQPRPKINQLLSRRPTDAQIIYPNTLSANHSAKLGAGAKVLPSGAKSDELAVQILPASKKNLPADQIPVTKSQGTDLVTPRTAKPARFRSAPKGYAVGRPRAAAADNSYVIAVPPKLKLSKNSAEHDAVAELGVVQNYRRENPPAVIGDRAPIGKIKEQEIASGHGRAAGEPEIKADNTSNYSFSKKAKPVDNNRYALGGQSPFITTVNVEKRPLSDNISHDHPKIERPKVPEKETKLSRKNVYTKKSKTETKRDLPTPPTVIVPSSRRSKVPLFFLVLLTIILGAAVGAAAYLCFFQ